MAHLTKYDPCNNIWSDIFFMQGCSGTLNGTNPSAGTLQWSIQGASQKGIYITFSAFSVSCTISSV